MTEEEFNREAAEMKRKAGHLPERYRMLPASDIGERGVICSIFLAPKECVALCIDHGITPDSFHNPAFGAIYSTFLWFHDQLKPIEPWLITQHLADTHQLEQVGGAALISELYGYLPTATNIGYYIELLNEKSALRQVIKVGTEFGSRGYEDQDAPWELINEFQVAVLKLGEKKRAKFTTAREAVMQSIGIIQDTYERRGSITGLSTGFPDFDRLTNGLQDSEMIVIAARPSQGKTAFAMNIVEHIAITLQKPVGVFSLEMPTQQLTTRMLCSRAKVNLSRIRDGYLADRDFPAITAAAGQISEAPIIFDESSDLTIQELRVRLRRMKQENKICAAFIDYLQLVRSSSKKSADNREREVAEVSAGIKSAAKELGIPIVVLAQISRQFEQRGPQARPRLGDLRESGAIEQDADLVAFLIRAETLAETEHERIELEGQAEIIIAKHRSGPLGDIPLTFLKEFTRFEPRATADDYAEADAGQAKMDYGSPI